MSDWYVLDKNRNVIGPVDMLVGAKAIEKQRRVALTDVYDGCKVSTVFLGLDHSFTPGGPPLVFETMVFGGPFSDEGGRYSTWAEAEAGHARWVEKCQPIMTEELP